MAEYLGADASEPSPAPAFPLVPPGLLTVLLRIGGSITATPFLISRRSAAITAPARLPEFLRVSGTLKTPGLRLTLRAFRPALTGVGVDANPAPGPPPVSFADIGAELAKRFNLAARPGTSFRWLTADRLIHKALLPRAEGLISG